MTVAMFIWYLLKRDASIESAMGDLTKTVGEMNQVLMVLHETVKQEQEHRAARGRSANQAQPSRSV